MYDEFQAEIKRLTEEVEYYKDRYDMVCKINNQQMETISTYAHIVKLQEEALQAEYEDYEHATLVDIKEPLKVSVVRCKDCKNWRESHSEDEESYCYIDGRTTDSTDYCSWGERREP